MITGSSKASKSMSPLGCREKERHYFPHADGKWVGRQDLKRGILLMTEA